MNDFFSWLSKNPTFPVVLVSAIVAYRGFLTTRHLSRSKNAIDFESEYHQSEALATAMSKLLEWTELNAWNLTDAVIALASEPRHDMVKHIRELLNTWERTAIAIHRNVYDEDLLYQAYGTSLIWIWKQTAPYILKRQQVNKKLYINVVRLAVRWQARRDSENN